jgi:hypothetical protein
VGELRRGVPPVAASDAGVFFRRDVDHGVREVGQSPGVVGVAVRQDDVPHVAGPEAEGFDPADGGVGFVELEAGHLDERSAQPPVRVPHVEQADAGIDQGEAAVVVQQ